jgi:hypothetical protein
VPRLAHHSDPVKYVAIALGGSYYLFEVAKSEGSGSAIEYGSSSTCCDEIQRLNPFALYNYDIAIKRVQVHLALHDLASGSPRMLPDIYLPRKSSIQLPGYRNASQEWLPIIQKSSGWRRLFGFATNSALSHTCKPTNLRRTMGGISIATILQNHAVYKSMDSPPNNIIAAPLGLRSMCFLTL